MGEAYEDVCELVPDAQSFAELEQSATESGFVETFMSSFERINGACLALQSLADENGIAVDLECEEGEGA